MPFVKGMGRTHTKQWSTAILFLDLNTSSWRTDDIVVTGAPEKHNAVVYVEKESTFYGVFFPFFLLDSMCSIRLVL